MVVRRSLVFIGILVAGSIVGAKTPAQLKIDMNNVLPAGMKVRMAWCNSPATSGGGLTAYVYDSEENVIRDLTPTSEFGSSRNITNAFVSQDGEYVVLKDNSSDAIQAVKFDGTGKQALMRQGKIICTWKDPADGKQCFIASGLPSPNATGTWAVGITDQTKRVQIHTETFPKASQWGSGCGVSVDGKRIGGFNGDWPGLWKTPSGAYERACCECSGCNYSMRPTTGTGVYEYGHFPESHFEICVHNADGTKKGILPMSCSEPGGDEPQSLRWTNHVDLVTFLMGEGSATNPILFNLATKKCVALQIGECSGSKCAHTGQNAILLSKVSSEKRIPSAKARISHAAGTPRKLYSIEGRLLSQSKIDLSTSAVHSLRVSVGNQAAEVIVGWR